MPPRRTDATLRLTRRLRALRPRKDPVDPWVPQGVLEESELGPDGRLKTARKGTGHFDVRVEGRASHAGLDPEKPPATWV